MTERGRFLHGFEVWRGPTNPAWPSGPDDLVPVRAKVATIRGRAYPRGAREASGFALGTDVTWIFAAPGTADIRAGDHIVTPADPDRPAVGGRRLRVERVLPTSTGRRLECHCTEPE